MDGIDPRHSGFGSAATGWQDFSDLPFSPHFPSGFIGEDATAGCGANDASPGSAADRSVPAEFVGDEVGVDRSAFETPVEPPQGWCQLEDVVSAYKEAANACVHRFNVAVSSSGHYCKKLGGSSVVDYALLYCSCSKQPPGQTGQKPHSKSFCPWNVRLKLDKVSMTWKVVSFDDKHHCTPLPDYTITATGMRMLRRANELTSEETAFIYDQFDNVGTYPRLIQWNFSRKFHKRKPASDLISAMRIDHQTRQYGLQTDNVARLRQNLDEYKRKGGVGTAEWDEQLQISRLVVLRPEMVPFLKKYGRVLVCDATHGITMSKFRLFTVVVVDSLLHSALVAYAFIRTEAAIELSWICKELGLTEADVVFVSDDNPAARILCEELSWIHILCQWHYAQNWAKACNKAKVSKADQFRFGEVFYHLMTSVDFKDEEDFSNQLRFFCDALCSAYEHMRNWCDKFSQDIELVCEWARKDLYTAGLVYQVCVWLVYHLKLSHCRCTHNAEKRISQRAHQRRHSFFHYVDGHVISRGELLPGGSATQVP